ncbi:TPA: sugar ABC transporter substrate-binding protein [Yersinia enterocolitica]
MKKWQKVVVLGLALSVWGGSAFGRNDSGPTSVAEHFKDKTVVLIPMAMGMDLSQGWVHYIGNSLKAEGIHFETRDPNWKPDDGAEALTDAINRKVAAVIVQSPDLQSYSRLYNRAQQAGIYVIQVDNPSNFSSDAFVGSNWATVGQLEAQAVVSGCGANSTQKIGVIQGDQVNASSLDQWAGLQEELKKHPGFEVVAAPYSNWDETTARNVTSTLIQQHPDVCGIVDFWSTTAQGTGAAIRDAGKTGKIFLATTGGGEQADCDRLSNGVIDALVSTDVPNQSRDISTLVKYLLQSGIQAGSAKTWIYTPESITTRADLKPGTCWSLKANAAA